MTSAIKTIRFEGILHGAGGASTCILQAEQTMGELDTTNWSIISVSELLPQGDYELLAQRKWMQARYLNGHWLIG